MSMWLHYTNCPETEQNGKTDRCIKGGFPL